MNANQKRLLLPIAILALGLVALIGAVALILGGGGEQGKCQKSCCHEKSIRSNGKRD